MKLSTVETFKMLRRDAQSSHYLTGDLLRKYQSYLLRMLEDVIAVCEREGIVHALCGGTALGAVRNGGFIPWDDDVDMVILGEDYARFRECFLRDFGERYWVQDAHTPGYGKSIARVCLKNSVYRDYDSSESVGCFFIDIFLVESVPDARPLRALHGFLCLSVGFMLSCRSFFAHRGERMRIARENPEILSAVRFKIAVGAVAAVLPLRAWVRLTWWCYALCKNRHSKDVGIPSGRKHYFGEIHPRAGMVNTVRMPFEGHMWRVPEDYDGYFRALYGPDYMTPPPEDQREHHFFFELKFPDEM